MDQTTAQELFDSGAMLLLLDVPLKTEIGIDMHSWQTAEKFKGIKMIPPGLHFIYFSCSSKEGDMSPRSGFFRLFKKGEVVVRKWNGENETFDPEVTDADECERFLMNKRDFDKSCGPYPYDSYKQWISLSQHISEDVVSSVQPTNGFIYSACALVSETSNTSTRAAKPRVEDIPLIKMNADNLMSGMKEDVSTVMNYTPISRFLSGSNSAMITQCATDSNLVLEQFITQAKSWQNVLGELQMAFLCFLIGQQFDSFDQWKKLVALLCNNQSSISKYEAMYTELISILHFELKEMPEDFFVDIVSSNNFLTTTLHDLFVNICESDCSEQLKTRVKRFTESLTKRFGWDFDAEPDDCAPVIVDEHGNY